MNVATHMRRFYSLATTAVFLSACGVSPESRQLPKAPPATPRVEKLTPLEPEQVVLRQGIFTCYLFHQNGSPLLITDKYTDEELRTVCRL